MWNVVGAEIQAAKWDRTVKFDTKVVPERTKWIPFLYIKSVISLKDQ